MADSKDTEQKASRIPFPLLTAAYLLFFCLECALAVEVRSVAFFADSIFFLEGASVSILMWPPLDWTLPGRKAFASFSRTMIFVPTCFTLWMIAANYYAAEIPAAVPMAMIGGVMLLSNIACLSVLSPGMSVQRGAKRSQVQKHAVMNAAVVLAALLTWGSGTMWPDVVIGVGILFMNAGAGEHVELAARLPPARAA